MLQIYWSRYTRMVENWVFKEKFDQLAETLPDWKNDLFLRLIIFLLPVATIAMIPGLLYAFLHHYWPAIITTLSCFGLMVGLTFSSILSLNVRKIGFLFIAAFFSVAIIIMRGPFGIGEYFLCSLPVLAVLILPERYGWMVFGFNLLFIAVFALLIGIHPFHKEAIYNYNTGQWIARSASLLFLDVIFLSLYGKLFLSIENTMQRKKSLYQNYSDLFNANPLPMWLVSQKTLAIIDCNHAAMQRYGYSRQNFLSKSFETIDASFKSFNPKADSIAPTITRHRTFNGDSIFVEQQISQVDNNGQPAILIVAADITNTLLMNEKLQKINAKLVHAEQVGKMGYWEMDMKKGSSYFSDGMYSLLNRNLALGLPSLAEFAQLIHPDDRATFWQRVNEKNYHDNQKIEYRLLTPQGIKYLQQRLSVKKDDNNELLVLEGIFQDVTDTVLYQNQLKETAFNMQAVLDSSLEKFILIDGDNKIRLFNNNAYNFSQINLPIPYAVGQNIFLYVDKVTEQGFEEVLNLVKKGEAMTFEKAYINAEARTIWYSYNFTPVYDDGKVVGVCIVGRDITIKKQYTQTIEEQNRKFKDIAWAHSHQVRASLVKIMGLQALLADSDEVEDKAKLLGFLSSACNELDATINQVNILTEV